jgi:iron complex outermembrane receptor protein
MNHIVSFGLEGDAYGWDINTGITYAKSKASDALDSGYLNYGKTSEALLAGKLNPLVHNNLKMLVYGIL